MKILASAIAILASVGLAASASAASLTPANGAFTGAGAMSLSNKDSLTIPCTANFTGHTTAGVGTIDYANFSGNGVCAMIIKNGTWTVNATGSGTATITGVAFLLGGVACGPATINVAVSSGGLITFSNQALNANCIISGSVQTSPVVNAIP
uniref:Putative activator of alkane oxidation n=1 Tax=Caulobacter sp. (strain K31) TaxID=366602 RepID=B0SXK9_CAUSK